ncbi:hypothetical protein SteCoe_23897 [Stentor coeruleus]|uniref:Uncharacterized protein n=1 Tax=Stentor coeruleus TaxID=5963 RepID=A0A1R2BIV2_9CILI|nr:hypothetical protein SteCoe_27186 [Stentor coeruleus]OMJ76671.1 hypothetical protein SteCoe_23897 [Stentor coeruleus]
MESYNQKKKPNVTNTIKSLLSKNLGFDFESGLGEDSDLSTPSYKKPNKKPPNSILKNGTNNSSYSNLYTNKFQNDLKKPNPSQQLKNLDPNPKYLKKSRKNSFSSKNISPINIIQKKENNPRSISESPKFLFNKDNHIDKNIHKHDEAYEMSNHDNIKINPQINYSNDDMGNQFSIHQIQKINWEKNHAINENSDIKKYKVDDYKGNYVKKNIGFDDKDDERLVEKYFMKKKEDKKTVLKIKEYEKLIEKQANEIAALKSKFGNKYYTPKYPKSVSPFGEKQKSRIHVKNKDFWRLDDQSYDTEPTRLNEVPGYKDLWIFNIESKMDTEKKIKRSKNKLFNLY